MLDKIEMYIGQGLYYLKSSIAIALIIYSIILATLWIIGNRNSIKTKLIPINKLIFESYTHGATVISICFISENNIIYF